MEFIKNWKEGEGSLKIIYKGEHDDSITISSDINEGIDRSIEIQFKGKEEQVVLTKTVKQEGMREIFVASDGNFLVSDGGTFNVLKDEF